MQYWALVRLPHIFTCQDFQCGWLSLMLPLDLLVDDHASRNNARLFVLPRAENPSILVDSCHLYGLCGTRPGSPFRSSSPQILVFRSRIGGFFYHIIDAWLCMGIYCSAPDASAIAIAPGDHKYTATRAISASGTKCRMPLQLVIIHHTHWLFLALR